MQGRRNPSDGRGYNDGRYSDGRGYNSNYRNYNRSGSSSGNFSRKQYLPPPPRRTKEEILMEAGRLAAEYLVYKGLLPASALPPKGQNSRLQGFRGQDREPAVADGRTSALDRLGNVNPNGGNGRRRYGDEYDDRMGPRDQFRGKKRMAPYGRDHGSDWGRENSGRWIGRNRGYNDMEDEEDYAPGYQRDKRGGFGQMPSRSENTVESGSENHDITEDTGSKASSSSNKRDPPSEIDGEFSKTVTDHAKFMNLEAGEEVRSDASEDPKKKSAGEESSVEPGETEGESKCGDDLMKLCNFAAVPTRPRSSIGQKSPNMEQGIASTEPSNTVEGSFGELKVATGEDTAGGSSNNSPKNQMDAKSEAPVILNDSYVQHMVESVEKRAEGSENPPDFGALKSTVDEAEETDEGEVLKRRRDSSSDDEFSRMDNARAKKSSQEIEKPQVEDDKVAPATVVKELPVDEEMVAPPESDQEKPLSDALIPKVEPKVNDETDEEKQLLPSSFKICDLNLMHRPEVTEIPDDPDTEHLHLSASRLETGKEIAMDFGLSIGNNSNGANNFSRLAGDDKVIQVIDLDDDSTVDATDSDTSRPKDEPVYPNLDSFLNQPEHADLPGIQDGYSLEISEFLGSDISRCPSVPSDLNNLQGGMGLHDAEGVPNDDDSIYVSLGEIPIGFMEVWDQPPQEYGKFF